MNKDTNDQEWVDRCIAGDAEAFEVLVKRYTRPVFNAVLHMVGNQDDAREICQQVFMKTFEHLASFDRERNFFSWIYRVAMNESINHLKSRRTFEILDERMESGGPSPAESAEILERRQQLRSAVMSLDPNYRTVIILRHFLNLSYREAADLLGVPEKTVKSRLFSARQVLRETLDRAGVTP